ncbi:MAG: hypothetical protein ACRDJV_04870 [Actinomycetota bacterium]
MPEHLRSVEAALGRAVERLYRWLSHNRVTRFPWAVIQTFSEAQGALLSGSMAYFTFLSLLPLIMVAGFVLGTVSSRNVEVQLALAEPWIRSFPARRATRAWRETQFGCRRDTFDPSFKLVCVRTCLEPAR